MSPDSELVGAYVAERSETAFRTLVARHVDLVYGTAVRQVGDKGVAEEITQDVFITLAKKALRLAAMETLAGWLHRTTILECKARMRSEWRRRTREEAAAVLAMLEREGETSLDTLIPMVDEALLHLRESDRIALMLRFFENQSLREVGVALGVDEDAARKRVSRALDRLMEFFRQRGFVVPAGTGIGVLLTNSGHAAPMGLASLSAGSGFAAGTVSGLQLGLFYIMNLSGTKTVVGCLLVAGAPLLWQSNVEARLNDSLAITQQELVFQTRKLEDIDKRSRQVIESIAAFDKDTEDAQSRFALLNAQRTGQAPRPTYQWDDNSPYMRLPKQFLNELPQGLRQQGHQLHVSETVKEFLQMTDEDARRVRVAVQDFYDRYEALLVKKARPIEPTKEELWGHKPEDTRVFEVDGSAEEVKEFRRSLFAEIESVLGAERFSLFRGTLDGWMPINDEYAGLNSGMVVFDFPHRRCFHKSFHRAPGQTPSIAFALSVEGRGSFYSSVEVDRIPRAIAVHLQDWIAEANAPEPGNTQPK